MASDQAAQAGVSVEVGAMTIRQRAEQVFSKLHAHPYYNEDKATDIAAIESAMREQVEAAAKVASDVSRCMCPFTAGCNVEGWNPDMKLGSDGKHKPYCPFGIAAAIRRLKEEG